MKVEQLHPEYVTDRKGHKKAVILPIGEFDELLEDLDDLAEVPQCERFSNYFSLRKSWILT